MKEADKSYQKLNDRLHAMQGHLYLYKTLATSILSWKFDGSYCTVVTNREWLTRPCFEMFKVLDEFLEVETGDEVSETSLVSREPEAVVTVTPNIQTLAVVPTLIELMMDNIGKIKADKAYVAQGAAVSDSVKVMIELAKTEIDATRLANDLVRRR